MMPEVSASDTRLYYLDGDSTVRALTPGGTPATVTRVPGSTKAHAGFAVSPDDRRIAVSVIDYTSDPATLRLYVEDVVGGSNHIELFSSKSTYVWPVGWSQGKIVLAVGPAVAQFGAPNPYDAIDGYHVVDAANANRLSSVCPTPEAGLGLIEPAGALCGSSSARFIESWSGSKHEVKNAAECSVMSPSGQRLACGGQLATGTVPIFILEADGTRTQTPARGFGPLGWIDETHLIFASGPGSSSGINLLDVRTGAITTVAPDGTFVARLPGSLD
jgi:hypothetical protein